MKAGLMMNEPIETPDQREARQREKQVAKAHRENVRQNIERRIQAAQAQGNQKLVQQLKGELLAI
ncbi:MAG: hypothetical protein ACRCT1_18310 [Microcoleaceae cyanobacterium]